MPTLFIVLTILAIIALGAGIMGKVPWWVSVGVLVLIEIIRAFPK
jgi:hypothetical protein